jgi:glucosamine-6-phosphate deaminase
VFVAYQTSGAIAVKDEDLNDRLEFARGVSQLMENSHDITAETIADQSGVLHNAFANGGSIKASSGRPSSSGVKNDLDSGSSTSSVVETLRDLLAQKPAGHPDPRPVQRAKALVRRCEAQSAAGVCGVPNSRVRFLDLPFYETGEIIKAPLSDRDVDIVQQLLEETQPDVIFAAGDLSDPHGTHRTCLVALLRALDRVHLTKSWYKQRGGTKILLYRGAWQEWALHEADLFVPLTPQEMHTKIEAILRHQSQKDPPLFPGLDGREFWERAKDRNEGTARLLAEVGFQAAAGVEAFVVCQPPDQEDGPWSILDGTVHLPI